MPEPREMVRKRAVLATAYTQFSSEVQPIKQSALRHIAANILFASRENAWVETAQLQKAFKRDSGGYTISDPDVDMALRGLIEAGRAERHPKGLRRYRLTLKARRAIAAQETAAEKRLSGVLKRLFGSDSRGASRYRDGFIDILSGIFGRLEEESARLVSGKMDNSELFSAISLQRFIDITKRHHADLDPDILRSGVERFFSEDDPQFAEIKWNFGQSLFVAKMLGLDPTGGMLSDEMFRRAIFYLDTNVIIAALEPSHRSHRWFESFIACATKLGAELRVTEPTLRELENWLAKQRFMLRKLVGAIPDDLVDQIDDMFIKTYERACARGQCPAADELLAHFSDPRRDLAEQYGVTIDPDPWYESTLDEGTIDAFAEALRARYRELKRRVKATAAARHDALVLSGVERCRETAVDGVWFVTTDTTLPGAVPAESDAASLAVTADALLQWISPIAGPQANTTDFATGFSHMVRERLLPRDRFFDLKDFLFLHELNIDMKKMPVEDVERTLREMKAQGAHLDQSNPADREQLALIVRRSLADLGSKYQQNLARLEGALAESELSREEERRLAGERDQELRLDFGGKILDQQAAMDQLRIDTQLSIEEIKTSTRGDKLRSEAKLSVAIVALVLFLAEAGVIYLADRYGAGANLWQRLVFSWVIPVGTAGVILVMGGVAIGKERLSSLDIPVLKLFRVDG